MDLPTLQNYLREEQRPRCIMDEGGRGLAFSCPTKVPTDFKTRKEVGFTLIWRSSDEVIFPKKGELTFMLFYHSVQS